ncbi:MAG TPA: ROK family protein [Nitrospinae bacterium]|nr:ROK family protein [Nitrospinota bacterium]
MKDYVIGLDLGGTNIRAAAITKEGNILHRVKIPTGVPLGRERVIANILKVIDEIKKELKGIKLSVVGMGIPGIIFFNKGIVAQSPNFPDWIDFNLRERLNKDLDVPFYIDNDANLAAAGEGWLGAGKEFNSFCMLTLGTGVGGGIVLNKNIWRGEYGMAGELGHITIYPDGHPCNCGNRGCLEQYVSANGIVRMAEEKSQITANDIYQLAKKGNKDALEIFQKMGRILGIGIADLVNILNIELFVLGGGVADSWNYFIPSTMDEVRKRTYHITGEGVKVVKAELGDDAGIFGAAYMAMNEFKSSGVVELRS